MSSKNQNLRFQEFSETIGDNGPGDEESYWGKEHTNRPYYNAAHQYDHYRLAYQAGMEAYDADPDQGWEDREADAHKRWQEKGGAEYMSWEDARPAAMDAYTRLYDRSQELS